MKFYMKVEHISVNDIFLLMRPFGAAPAYNKQRLHFKYLRNIETIWSIIELYKHLDQCSTKMADDILLNLSVSRPHDL